MLKVHVLRGKIFPEIRVERMQLSLVLSPSKQISIFIDLDGLCAGCFEWRDVSCVGYEFGSNDSSDWVREMRKNEKN